MKKTLSIYLIIALSSVASAQDKYPMAGVVSITNADFKSEMTQLEIDDEKNVNAKLAEMGLPKIQLRPDDMCFHSFTLNQDDGVSTEYYFDWPTFEKSGAVEYYSIGSHKCGFDKLNNTQICGNYYIYHPKGNRLVQYGTADITEYKNILNRRQEPQFRTVVDCDQYRPILEKHIVNRRMRNGYYDYRPLDAAMSRYMVENPSSIPAFK